MNTSYLTRQDTNVGARSFDSIEWAFETHLQMNDSGAYNFALLFGNEDAPSMIQFWRNEPNFDTPADFIWKQDSV